MIPFLCPHCSASIKAPPGTSGKVVGCPRCKQKIKIPQAPQDKTEVMPRVEPPAQPEPEVPWVEEYVGPVPPVREEPHPSQEEAAIIVRPPGLTGKPPEAVQPEAWPEPAEPVQEIRGAMAQNLVFDSPNPRPLNRQDEDDEDDDDDEEEEDDDSKIRPERFLLLFNRIWYVGFLSGLDFFA